MKEATKEMAHKIYEEYIEEGLKMFPPFKGFGMKFIQFSIDEPEYFKSLFMSRNDLSYIEFLESKIEWNRVIPSVQAAFSLNERDARLLFKNMMIYSFGLASLFVNSACVMTEEEISEHIGNACRGFLATIKMPKDERTKIIPSAESQDLGKVEDYISGKRNVIVGYGANKEMYQIRLDAILYFEAVGENVFAYTRGNVYEIKHRLYKIEEIVKNFEFIRVSKSLLVSKNKITSISSGEGGRKNILMLNGETVVASRLYVKDLMNEMKGSV